MTIKKFGGSIWITGAGIVGCFSRNRHRRHRRECTCSESKNFCALIEYFSVSSNFLRNPFALVRFLRIPTTRSTVLQEASSSGRKQQYPLAKCQR